MNVNHLPEANKRDNDRKMEAVEILAFELPGTPVSKGRPRFTTTGRAYTDAKTREAEKSILAAYLSTFPGRRPHDGAVEILVEATFLPPESWAKWKRDLALSGDYPHLTKPDFDNLAKIIDGLNGRAFVDDSQVVEGHVRKRYGSYASTRITLTLYPAPPTKKEKK